VDCIDYIYDPLQNDIYKATIVQKVSKTKPYDEKQIFLSVHSKRVNEVLCRFKLFSQDLIYTKESKQKSRDINIQLTDYPIFFTVPDNSFVICVGATTDSSQSRFVSDLAELRFIFPLLDLYVIHEK